MLHGKINLHLIIYLSYVQVVFMLITITIMWLINKIENFLFVEKIL